LFSEGFQRVEEALFLHDFQMRGAFAAGQDDSGKAGEASGGADVGVGDAETVEHRGVGFEVTLDGEDADFHLTRFPKPGTKAP